MKFHVVHPTKSKDIAPHIKLFNDRMYRETKLFDAYDAEHPQHFDSQAAFVLRKELHSNEKFKLAFPAEAIAGIGLIRYNTRNRPDVVPSLAAVRFRKADSNEILPTSKNMVNRIIDISDPKLARLDDLELCTSAIATAAYRHLTGAQQPLDLILDTLQDDTFARDFIYNQR